MTTRETKNIQKYRQDYDRILQKLKLGQSRILVNPRRIQSNIQYYLDTMDVKGYFQWENCRSAFKKARSQRDNIDELYLADELRKYLINFGMNRGANKSFLRDSNKLIPTIRCILSTKYDKLFDLTPKEILNSWRAVEKICLVSSELRIALQVEQDYHASTTMITKILMGTYATIPAFDRFLCRATHCLGTIQSHNFPIRHLVRLAQYYEDNTNNFQNIVDSSKESLLDYSEMRLVDMVMWREGQLIEAQNKI